MTDEPKVAAFSIAGPQQPWPGREAYLETVQRCTRLFCNEMRRLPEQHEIDMLCRAVANHYGRELDNPLLRNQ